jgi:hypothetical protein
MNKIVANLIGGLAGAAALNIIHQTVKQIDHDAPRVDLVGEEALNKVITSTGGTPLRGNVLFTATLAADLLSNAIYYSAIGFGKKKHLLWRGAGYGLAAGALQLTEPMGLSDAPITKTDKTKALTVAWYVLGGVVAALTIKALRKKNDVLPEWNDIKKAAY